MDKLSFAIGGSYLGSGDLQDIDVIGTLVGNGVALAFSIAGILVLFFFITGGISMIKGAGNSNPQSVAKGKQAITSGVVGFFIIFLSYWIVRYIEVITALDIL